VGPATSSLEAYSGGAASRRLRKAAPWQREISGTGQRLQAAQAASSGSGSPAKGRRSGSLLHALPLQAAAGH
jgi:hypothetical protein